MPKFSCFVLLLLITSRILSQETRQNFRYSISKTQQTINVDGDESDPAWSVVNDIPNFMNHWTVEMAIPFKTLRYTPNQSEWGVNFIRGDMERNAISTWTQFPLNYAGIDLNFMGTLDWDANPKKASGKVVLVPYLSGGTQRDFEEEEQRSYDKTSDAGIDTKVAITGSLNFDLTVNPDFSNVDVV